MGGESFDPLGLFLIVLFNCVFNCFLLCSTDINILKMCCDTKPPQAATATTDPTAATTTDPTTPPNGDYPLSNSANASLERCSMSKGSPSIESCASNQLPLLPRFVRNCCQIMPNFKQCLIYMRFSFQKNGFNENMYFLVQIKMTLL